MQNDRAARIADLIEAIRLEVLAELAAGEAQSGPGSAQESVSDVQSASGRAGLLALARAVDQVERVAHGLLLQVLGRMDQVRAVPGGVGPWLASQLGYSPGRGRNVASDARRLVSVPEVEQMLSSGELPVGAPRMLARAVHATRGTSLDPAQAVTDTVAALEDGGVQQAEAQVRALEHAVEPGRAETLQARQRARCFARLSEVGEGMVRLEALLDAQRAELVRSGMDILTSGWLRARQYDGTDPLPEDVQSVEQMNAEALARFAAVFLNATEAQRAKPYFPGVLFIAPSPDPGPGAVQDPAAESDPQPRQDPAAPVPYRTAPIPARVPIPAGCVETARGQWIPAPRVVPESAAVRLTVTPDGEPLAVNGRPLDENPTARLASADQRVALYWRDRTCTHPGCTRPITWSLHAHHRNPYSVGGPTTTNNLTLLCSEHHVLTHQEAAATT
jgi:hypothetical protein